MSESIVIANSTIRQQDGLYCLNDLHRASGGALQRLGAAQGSISIRAAAKSLKHPEKALIGRLLAMGYLYRLNGRLAAAQPYTKNGWFEHKYGDSDGKAFMQVLVTPLGMMKLAQKLEIAV